MSVKVMGAVWGLDLPANEMLVLLAMADHSDHEGNNIFPSIGLIAWKTGYSESQVRRIIKRLVKSQVLTRQERRGESNLYRIDLSKGTQKEEYKSAKSNPLQNDTPSIAMTPQGLHSYDTPTPVIAMTPEPSLEPSMNHPAANIIPLNDETPPPAKSNSKRKEDPFFEAIATVWETRAGGFVGGVKSMMLGTASGKGQYAKSVFDKPVTDAAEILEFGQWAKGEMRRKSMTEMPTYAVTIQKWFYDFRADQERKANRKDTDYIPVNERTSALHGAKLVS